MWHVQVSELYWKDITSSREMCDESGNEGEVEAGSACHAIERRFSRACQCWDGRCMEDGIMSSTGRYMGNNAPDVLLVVPRQSI